MIDCLIRALGQYHPYRGGCNPAFDDYSRLILDLKRGTQLRYFAKYLAQNVDPSAVDVICVVPSHRAGGVRGGMHKVAEIVALVHKIQCGCHCLQRVRDIPKLANGGSRNLDVHLDSIIVQDADLVRGRRVLLVDDVVTSGNSLHACRQILLAAGASEVQCMALARTV